MKQLSQGSKVGRAIVGFALMLTVVGGVSLNGASAAEFGYGGSGGSTSNGGGGGGGFAGFSNPTCSTSFDAPAEGFRVHINRDAKTTNDRSVTLSFDGGNAVTMAISNSQAFTNAAIVPYAPSTSWTLPEGNGTKNIYVRFYNNCGASSSIVSSVIDFTAPSADANNPANPPKETNVDLGDGQVLGTEVTLIDELIARLPYGRRNDEVTKLQTELVRLGYMPRGWNVTNFYGKVTLAAVTRYVDAHPLAVKDVVTTVRFGQSHPNVRRLQAGLKALGLLPRNWRINSYYGVATRNAVKAFNAR